MLSLGARRWAGWGLFRGLSDGTVPLYPAGQMTSIVNRQPRAASSMAPCEEVGFQGRKCIHVRFSRESSEGQGNVPESRLESESVDDLEASP